jgi:hypothetical protein
MKPYKLDSISDEEAKRQMERREQIEALVRGHRNEVIDVCAKVAASHNGISPKDSRDIATKIRNLIEKGQS